MNMRKFKRNILASFSLPLETAPAMGGVGKTKIFIIEMVLYYDRARRMPQWQTVAGRSAKRRATSPYVPSGHRVFHV